MHKRLPPAEREKHAIFQTLDKSEAVPAVEICGWQPRGASPQLIGRVWRVVAKTLPVFAWLILERVSSQAGFINAVSTVASSELAEPRDNDIVTHTQAHAVQREVSMTHC